jgi:hypothetical protein
LQPLGAFRLSLKPVSDLLAGYTIEFKVGRKAILWTEGMNAHANLSVLERYPAATSARFRACTTPANMRPILTLCPRRFVSRESL